MCIKLYISATIQPILMNEHSFCTILNVPDGSVTITAIMCKVMTLLFHMHINTRLYIFRKKRTYCYILFSNRSVALPSNNFWHQKIAMKMIYPYISIMYDDLNLKVPYAPIYRRLSLKTQTGWLFGSGEVEVLKALYLSQYTTDSDEWTFFLHDLKCTRLWYSHQCNRGKSNDAIVSYAYKYASIYFPK